MTRRAVVMATTTKLCAGLFADMLNPHFRGPNFDFRKFDIGAWAGVHVCMMVEDPGPQLVEDARECARRLWADWVRRAGEGLP